MNRYLAPLLIVAGMAGAQETPEAEPPGWLSDSLLNPHGDIATSATAPAISVMPIGAVSLDAVGLLSRSQTGLDPALWADSDPETLADLFRAQPVEGLPAMLSFTHMLALAELDPPGEPEDDGALFLARLDMLLARGALDPARAMMERAGPSSPQVFRRWFDVSLLSGTPDRACAAMRANPDIAPSFPARIFCLARGGDWNAAALSLGTGEALGYISRAEGDVIARFLDPELFEGDPLLPPDRNPSPLFYEMRAAIGERPGSAPLPLAFAQSDLAPTAGWRAQLAAAERLVRSGAITPDQWHLIATSRAPSASGAHWDRVRALQAFDAAILALDPNSIAEQLPDIWQKMRDADLEVPFAEIYAERLLRLPLTGDEAALTRRIALLSSQYRNAALGAVAQSGEERFLFALARGETATPPAGNTLAEALAAGLSAEAGAGRYTWLMDRGRAGEAVLRAARVIAEDHPDFDDLSDALALLSLLGQEDVARRAALQLMILSPGR